MIPFPFPFVRRARSVPAIEPSGNTGQLPAPAPIDLARFDSFTAAEVRALPGRLRRAVIADRRMRTNVALARLVAGKARAWE